MNVFKEAAKAATKIGHLDRKRDHAIARASAAHADAVRAVIREVGADVTKALVAQGIVHSGFAGHTEAFTDAVIEADAGPGEQAAAQ